MNCIHCKQEINPLRLKALPNTKTCVNCSTASPKKGITQMFGEKDHTWNDIQIVSSQQAMDIKAAANIKPKWDNYEN